MVLFGAKMKNEMCAGDEILGQGGYERVPGGQDGDELRTPIKVSQLLPGLATIHLLCFQSSFFKAWQQWYSFPTAEIHVEFLIFS